MKRLVPAILSGFLAILFAPQGGAAILAHYVWTDGDLTNNSADPGTHTLTPVFSGTGAVTVSPQGAALFPGNDGTNEAWLEAPGPGGASNFTVSLWVRTDSWNQGNYQGVISNNIGSATNYSWQVDVHGSGDVMRLVSKATTANPTITFPRSSLAADTWYHIVIRKSGSTGSFYVTPLGAGSVNSAGTEAMNPGGLQAFRLGTNRNDDSLLRMEMANVRIYDDASVDLDILLAEGPMLIPEASTALLSLLGGLVLLRRRRARKSSMEASMSAVSCAVRGIG